MKKTYLIILAMMLIPAFSMAALTNGNFATDVSGWFAYQCTPEWQSGSAPYGVGGHTKLTTTAGAASFSQNETEANSGEMWKWWGYVYCDGTWDQLEACWMDDYDYSRIESSIILCTSYTTGWTLVESVHTLTSDTQNRVWFGSYFETGTGRVAYIDEVNTADITEVTDWNLY